LIVAAKRGTNGVGPSSRRAFVRAVIGLAGLTLVSGCGARVPRLGLVGTPRGSTFDSFRAGLTNYGWDEGANLIVDARLPTDSAGRREVTELIDSRVDVLVATAASIVVAKQLTSTTPLVFLTSSDPVAEGLVANLARPGGNVTGVTTNPAEIAAKRVELLKAIRPDLERLAYLWDPALPAHAAAATHVHRAAEALSVSVLAYAVQSEADVAPVLGAIRQAQVDGLLAQASAPLIGAMDRIARFAIDNGMITAAGGKEYAEAGALLNYSVNSQVSQRRAAYHVDRILRGTHPGELAVEVPSTFDLIFNLGSARALGLTIPEHLLLQATELIG
jgi:putative ABC transport system substrate-binding protein